MITTKVLELFQICDSTFPIGTFNHSYGMEYFMSTRRIRKAPQFREWLEDYYRSQFAYGEGLLCLLAVQALENRDYERIAELDRLITCSTLARETRNGTKLIAKQMIQLIIAIYGDTIPHLIDYQKAIEEEQVSGNPALVFAIMAYGLGMSAEECYMAYGWSVGSTLVQNAVRAVPLGQREGQLILHDLIDLIGQLYNLSAELTIDELGANTPGLELGQILHETQSARLFMS